MASEVSEHAGQGAAPEPPQLRRLDRRARIVLGLFSRQETVTAPEMAHALGLSPRTVRDLISGWLAAGWNLLTRPANRAATIYRRNIGSLSAEGRRSDSSCGVVVWMADQHFLDECARRECLKWQICFRQLCDQVLIQGEQVGGFAGEYGSYHMRIFCIDHLPPLCRRWSRGHRRNGEGNTDQQRMIGAQYKRAALLLYVAFRFEQYYEGDNRTQQPAGAE